MHNVYLETYFGQYMALSDNKKRKLDHKYDSVNLFLETFNCEDWFENKESSDPTRKSDKEESTDTTRKTDKEEFVDLSDMPPLEGHEEELKEGKELKILTPNKLLNKLQMLLAEIKAGKKSYKLKNEIRQILYLLYQHNKITKNQVIIIMEENRIVIRDPKTFYFYFDWPKDVTENLKDEIKFIIKTFRIFS